MSKELDLNLAKTVITAQRLHLQKLNSALVNTMAMINNSATKEDRDFTAEEALLRHQIYSLLFNEDGGTDPNEPGIGLHAVLVGDDDTVMWAAGPLFSWIEAEQYGVDELAESDCCWRIIELRNPGQSYDKDCGCQSGVHWQ